jgi:hypothetical protein
MSLGDKRRSTSTSTTASSPGKKSKRRFYEYDEHNDEQVGKCRGKEPCCHENHARRESKKEG